MNKKRKDDGLVYRGECDLVHIEDGQRAVFGEAIAAELGTMMRDAAYASGARTLDEANAQPLCPGCYMVAIFNAAVTLAKANGQSMTELGNSMAAAFAELAAGGPDRFESIAVKLDPPPDDSDSILAAGNAAFASFADAVAA